MVFTPEQSAANAYCLFECGSACRSHLTDAARDEPLGYARKE